MKKENITTVWKIVLGIGVLGILGLGVFLTAKQTKQIEKEVTEIKRVSDVQFKDVNELIALDWKTYQDGDFHFHFKHPSSVFICENKNSIDGSIKFLQIYYGETCEFAREAKDPSEIFIKIKENKKNYKTAEEAFWGEAGAVDKSINADLGNLRIGGMDAYGGEIKTKTQGDWVTYSSGYVAVILKNDKLFIINDGWYGNVTGGESFGNKSLTDRIIASIHFDPVSPWK